MSAASLVLPEGASEGEGLTAGLEKGLCLFRNGRDLSEEGMGFGAPVVVAGNRTYLSFDAPLTLPTSSAFHWRKIFRLNAVGCLTRRDRPIEAAAPYIMMEMKARLYKSILPLQSMVMSLRSNLGLRGAKLTFLETEPLASIAVEYRILDKGAEITVDLSEITKLPDGANVYVLNEQGARSFSVYTETGGRILQDRSIGGWARVKASRAAFHAPAEAVSFSLCQAPGADLYRGRESDNIELSWSGLNYDVSRFTGGLFGYKVEL